VHAFEKRTEMYIIFDKGSHTKTSCLLSL